MLGAWHAWGQARLGIHSHPTCRGRRSVAAASQTCSSLPDSSKADGEQPQSCYRRWGSRQCQCHLRELDKGHAACRANLWDSERWAKASVSRVDLWWIRLCSYSIEVERQRAYTTRWISISIKQQLYSWSMFLSRDINSVKLQPSRREHVRWRVICYLKLQCSLMGSKPVWRTVPLICKSEISWKSRGR